MDNPIKIPPADYMSEEVVMFADQVHRFMSKELVPLADSWEEHGIVDRASWKKCGEQGILLASGPVEYGGGGGNFAHEAAIIEQSGHLGVDAINICVQNAIIAPYLIHYGTHEQKQAWLPGMASGDIVAAIAMTEPGAGSDLQGMRSSFRREGDNYVINGQKIFITNGIAADLILVACRDHDAQGAKAISLIAVEPEKVSGFKRGRKLDKIGLRGQDTAELFFDEVRVPRSHLLGTQEGQGFYQMMEALSQERLVVALQSMAMIERALAVTVEYVKQRKAFNRTVMDFQTVKFTLAEYVTEASIAKVFCQHCVSRLLDGSLDAETASMAKYWLSDLQGKIVDGCLQLHGGYGYMNEYPIARMYRDARVSRIYGGTNEIMKLLIARGL